MGAALLALRLLLTVVFVVAGVAKLADLAGSRRAVVAFGVPERLATVAAVGLPVAELVVAVALIPSASARFGALGALLLLAAFVAGIVAAMRRGTDADCHCFGQLHSAPIGWRTLARNVVLAAAAAFVVIGGWRHPGTSATGWIARLDAGWTAALGLGGLLVLVVGFLMWFALQLLSQNGRILARLEAIEAAISGSGGLDFGAELAPPLGAGLDAGGLPIGTPAPDFTLSSTNGDRHTLGSLLASGLPLLLVFADAGCGPCDALLPDVAGWQREQGRRLQVAVIASGDAQQNVEKADRHRLERVLLQPEQDVSDAYGAHGTPMAVVIGADGLIASPTVGGAEAIRTLVAQATAPPLAIVQMPASDGRGNGNPPPDIASGVGERAPELVLADLDGRRIALKDVWAERTLAIFWNPGCGFCQSMLADLKALEHDPPPDAPRLVVISTGDLEVTREHELRSAVMLDPEGQAMNAFGAHGTPMGVLVENGRVASPVAAGADAVLALARAAPTRQAGTARGEAEQSVGQR